MYALDQFMFVTDKNNRSLRIYNDCQPNGNVVKQVKLINRCIALLSSHERYICDYLTMRNKTLFVLTNIKLTPSVTACLSLAS